MLYSASMTPKQPDHVRRALTLGLTCVLALAAASDVRAVGSVSTVSPRPLGMGGAFLAVEDEVSAAAWNPAALLPRRCSRGGGFRVHLNVLGAPAIVRETGILTGVESELFGSLPEAERLAVALGSVFKSVSFSRGGFACGALLLEERLDPQGLRESKGLADAGDLLNGYYSSLCVAIHLGDKVSIGAAETVFAGLDGGERRFGAGRSYGALLRPNRQVTVGLVYFDAPPGFGDYRREIEGLASRTMNAGLAYRPHESLVLTLDLRDLAEKHRGTALAARAGVEWNLWGQGALRAGYFREESTDADVLSVGVGAIAMPGCREAWDDGRGDGFVLNYASLISSADGPRHLLSAVLHF
jgi:hypothetical protein